MALFARVAFAIALTLLGAVAPVVAGDVASVSQVKAAFLLNFPRFVEWPASAFAAPDEPLVVGLFGRDPFGGALDQLASGKTINGRPIRIRKISERQDLRSCHLIFVPASEMAAYADAARALGGLSVLTVGESSGFAEQAGMINFVIKDGHVHFEVNPSAAERSHLRVSSKLLQLAIIVGPVPHAK